MCYEYDDLFERMRLAEQMQREKKLADELARQSATPTPAKPAEPATSVEERQPVPA